MFAGPAPDFGISESFFVAHAHNIFLQVALDIGIVGLVAYVAMLAFVSHITYQLWSRQSDGDERVLCLGLRANLFAIHLFGLADAIALGTKVGVFLWWNLGLIAAVHNVTKRRWALSSTDERPL